RGGVARGRSASARGLRTRPARSSRVEPAGRRGATAVSVPPTRPGGDMPELQPGDQAPDFALVDQDGGEVRLADLAGRNVVLFLYPKADTPGCTTQACSLRDAEPDLGGLD